MQAHAGGVSDRRPVSHRWRALRGEVAIATLAMAFLGGCIQATGARRATRGGAGGVIGVSMLATKLGMEVAERTGTHVTLRRDQDTVMIFPNPDGQVYVNGRAVGSRGRVQHAGTEIFVPLTLRHKILAALQVRNSRPAGAPVQPKPRPPPAKANLGRVVIDPGHGGREPGAVSVFRVAGRQFYEKTVNLTVALAAAELLKTRGAQVILTRRSDVLVPLDTRVSIGNRARPKLFVSIHADSFPNGSPQGFTILVPKRASAKSLSAARLIERQLLAADVPGRGIRRDQRDLRVLRKARCPAVLIELGFLSNYSEAGKLASLSYRLRLGEAVADGVTEFLQDN